MFRPAQPGDWADEDEDVEVKAPQTYAQAAAPAGVVVASPRRQPTNATGNFNASPQRETQAPVANRWERFRQQQAEQQQSDHQYERSSSGGARGYGGRDRDRDRDYYGGGGRDRDYGNSRDYYGGGGGRDRDYGSRDRDYGGGRDRDHGYGGRDRGHRDDFRGPPMTTERGVVVSVKENFGFVSCVERDGDLFFHISEAPVDVELQDEVEFKVKYNQRSQKDIAVQLVRLPKGSIVWEDVTEELFDGVVAKGIPRSSSYHSHGSGGHSRDDAHGMIEVRRQQEQGDEATDEKKEAGDAESTEAPSSTSKRREFVRYSADSVGPIAGSEAEADQKSGKKSPVPHFGDEVRFRIATHRKSGLKRAVDLTVTLSAKAKLEKEMDEKLKTMTREQGVITRIKSGGGFIRCCERTDDVYFPFHEIRESEDDDKSKGKGKLQLREGDEVSFYVYEDKDGNDERPTHHSGSQRLSALRVVKLPTGTVSFEDVLRTNIEGVVTKVPKEPRSGPEIFGVINPSNPEDAVVPKDESEEKQSDERNNGKKLKKKAAGVSFRLSDASDVTYIPATGDVVMFDQVMDKRSRRVKASNVRIVQFNQKHRETGVITTVREEFGFIKCAERHADAYFRFGVVMSVNNDFRTGTEVAFDVSGDGKDSGKGHGKDKESVRAHRVEILPPGSVKWETELATDLEGELLVVPSRHHKQHQKPGGKPQQHKPQYGRVRVSLGKEKHLIDFFPEYKEQIAATFFADSESKDGEEELKLEFPSTLSKYERAAIHAYCDWLGIKHESSGDGANRRLTVSANARIEKTAIDSLVAAQADAPVTADLEFHAEDVVDVRYNPHVGDQVKLNLVLVKRSKQLLAKSVVLVTPAPSKPKATTAAKQDTDSQLPAGEGFIVVLKQDGGFGFIEPADQGVTGLENLFFHVKEIISGQTVADLKEGMEVKYHVIHDEKKKKTRATGIVVVPAGTVKKLEAALVRGVVHRPSLLHRFRKTNARFGKNDKNKQMSTPGRIRITDDEAASAVEEEEEEDEDDDEEGDAEEHTGEVEGEPKTTELESTKKPKEEKSKQKKPSSSSYIYFINDISDPTVILREGDEVEFVPHTSPKGLRAMKIKVVKSHAKQGVVVKVNSENGGVIKVDESDEEIGFAARGVLRGDTLGEGDRVEFAVVKRPVEKKKPAKKKEEEKKTDAEKSEGDAVEGETTGEAVAEDTSSGPETTSPFVATSILCLASAGNSKSSRDRDASRPESRTVNSTLLQAMRQVGASAVVKSRMAKGPDGTRGFPEGWRSSVKREPAVTPAPAE